MFYRVLCGQRPVASILLLSNPCSFLKAQARHCFLVNGHRNLCYFLIVIFAVNNKDLGNVFYPVAADSELKLSALSIPIVGNVNILRYLAFAYPNIIRYDHEDYIVDSLLDLCHVLERTTEKNKEAILNKLFAQCKQWIYGDQFSILDLAAFNMVKQWRSTTKHVPREWLNKCEKMCS